MDQQNSCNEGVAAADIGGGDSSDAWVTTAQQPKVNGTDTSAGLNTLVDNMGLENIIDQQSRSEEAAYLDQSHNKGSNSMDEYQFQTHQLSQ